MKFMSNGKEIKAPGTVVAVYAYAALASEGTVRAFDDTGKAVKFTDEVVENLINALPNDKRMFDDVARAYKKKLEAAGKGFLFDFYMIYCYVEYEEDFAPLKAEKINTIIKVAGKTFAYGIA